MSESCNSEVLFSLNAPATPYRPSKTFFWIKLNSKNKNIDLRDFEDASQIWILILLILLILILLILKLNKVLD